jgi:hypothetical protein
VLQARRQERVAGQHITTDFSTDAADEPMADRSG